MYKFHCFKNHRFKVTRIRSRVKNRVCGFKKLSNLGRLY